MKSFSRYVTTAFLSLRSLNSLANMMDKEAICMISQLNFHFHWFLTPLNFLNSHRQRKLQKKFSRLSELFQILAISELLILAGNFLEHTPGYENLTDWWLEPCTHYANSFRWAYNQDIQIFNFVTPNLRQGLVTEVFSFWSEYRSCVAG